MVFDIGTMINSDSILPNNPTSNNNPVLVGSDRIAKDSDADTTNDVRGGRKE